MELTIVRDAYERGIRGRHFGFPRVTPFYNKRVLIAGRKVDVTPLLDVAWFAGYDGELYPDKSPEPDNAVDA